MTVKEAVKILDEKVQKMEMPEGIVARVTLLVSHESEFLSEDELNRLDILRGEKLNLAHADSWKPEEITREDAELIRRGLNVYRDVMWNLHGEKMMSELRKVVEGLSKGGLDDENE